MKYIIYGAILGLFVGGIAYACVPPTTDFTPPPVYTPPVVTPPDNTPPPPPEIPPVTSSPESDTSTGSSYSSSGGGCVPEINGVITDCYKETHPVITPAPFPPVVIYHVEPKG